MYDFTYHRPSSLDDAAAIKSKQRDYLGFIVQAEKLDGFMREAAAHLIGQHDFTTFRSSICQAKSPLKTLDAIGIDEIAIPHGREYRFTLRARSFLHNQVRSIVGTLERVGAGSWQPERVARALAARDRAACGPVCPPHGLYLTGVGYPGDPLFGI